MLLRTAACWCLSLCLVLAAGATPPEGLSAHERKAYLLLAEAPDFSGLSVGFEGRTPQVAYAFRTLLAAPLADAAFRELLLEGTTAGKVYALCGLWHTDPLYFEKAVQIHRTSPEPLPMLSGCLAWTTTVGEFVEKKAEAVAIRRRDRHPPFEAWRQEAGEKKLRLDVLHGGWPSLLAEAPLDPESAR